MFDEVFVSQIAKMFLDSAMALNNTKRDFFKCKTRLYEHRVFFPQRQLTSFEHCVHEESFIAIVYQRKQNILQKRYG